MLKVATNPRILVVFEKNDLIPMFEESNKIMDTALKSLNSFLELKRQAFPRFYFLSNKEVLDILAVNKGELLNYSVSILEEILTFFLLSSSYHRPNSHSTTVEEVF